MVDRDSSKESLQNERQMASKISSRLEIMHKKKTKKERNRGENELRAAIFERRIIHPARNRMRLCTRLRRRVSGGCTIERS